MQRRPASRANRPIIAFRLKPPTGLLGNSPYSGKNMRTPYRAACRCFHLFRHVLPLMVQMIAILSNYGQGFGLVERSAAEKSTWQVRARRGRWGGMPEN